MHDFLCLLQVHHNRLDKMSNPGGIRRSKQAASSTSRRQPKLTTHAERNPIHRKLFVAVAVAGKAGVQSGLDATLSRSPAMGDVTVKESSKLAAGILRMEECSVVWRRASLLLLLVRRLTAGS